MQDHTTAAHYAMTIKVRGVQCLGSKGNNLQDTGGN